MKLRFDRGTIVLTDPPKELDLVGAPGVRWDPRVHAHRAPASQYPALKRWLLHRGSRFQDIPPPARPTHELWSDVDLRPYQEAALSAWELGHRRGVVALPTGSGKTRLALAAMHRTRLSTLCLVPTRVLLDQWLREIGALYRGPVGCYGDGVRRWAPLTIATFESAYRHMDQLGDRFDLVIVDEVHHFGGGLRDETLEMTIADARLGLTATPSRDPGVAARLTELVGATVFELAVADLAGDFLPASMRSRCTWTLFPRNEPRTRSWRRCSGAPMQTSARWCRTGAGRTSPTAPPVPPRAVAPFRRGARCDDFSPSLMPSGERWNLCWDATGIPGC